MRRSDAVGKRIVSIEQERVQTNSGVSFNIVAIVLDDGTRLCPNVLEAPDGVDYVVEMVVSRPKRAIRRGAEEEQA